MTDNKDKALALAELGMHVFPCRWKPHTYTNAEGKEVTLKEKSPFTANGFLDASTDPAQINAWWAEYPSAIVGVATGASGIVVLDIDVKRNDTGDVTVDGYDTIAEAFEVIPDTFSYSTFGGEGTHYIYEAPEGKNLAPAAPYRKMAGVDRRSGGSYVAWVGPVPKSRTEFGAPPQWFLDETEVRSSAVFEGTVKDWFDQLVPGEPNLLVRSAIDRIKPDMGHSEMVEAQHNAIRLGAEGNPGVPELLSALEGAWLDRPGENHTTPEDQWEYKFAEALTSGIEKSGAAVELLSKVPEFHMGLIPDGIPDRLVSVNGDRNTFTELCRLLVREGLDEYTATSVLWNAPSTKAIARDWGMEFTHKRVLQEMETPQASEGDNPILAYREATFEDTELLSAEDRELVSQHPTFIDEYLEASAAKGFHRDEYDIPLAWTVMSMAYGRRGFIPMSKPLGLNLWFLSLGPSSTGKTSALALANDCLDLMLKDGETFYNLGANSSPEGMHESLLERDHKPSMILHDEASDFFENLKRKDWMSGLKDQLAKWYEGRVDPIQKVRLKDLKGKSAVTSFNIEMMATPDRLLGLISTDMFETGFLARFNWTWLPHSSDHDERKYLVSRNKTTDEGKNPRAYDLVTDLLASTASMPKNAVALDWTDEAEDRLVLAHMKMDEIAKGRDRYGATEPGVIRLKETMWKCAGLLAMWRGDYVIREVDALTAIRYAETWFNTLFKVVEAAGEGEFNQDVNQIESYIASKDGVTYAELLTRFRGMIDKSPRELDDRIKFLENSTRITSRKGEGERISRYYVNVREGGKK